MSKKITSLLPFFLLVSFFGYSQSIFINEINHKDTGSKGVEIAGPAGTDLTNWTLAIYNPGGLPVNTIPLSSVIPDLQNTYGLIWIDVVMGMDDTNGGVGLIDENGTPVQFLSYGGQITAIGGLVAGLTTQSVGQQTVVNESLQLGGAGNVYPDFTWNRPGTFTPGAINTNQVFLNNSSGGGGTTILPVDLVFFEGNVVDNRSQLHWVTAAEKDNDYFRVEHSTNGKDFQEVGQISGQGFSTERVEYNFIHTNINNGLNYYRLVQIDFDGEETLSNIINLQAEVNTPPIVNVYPNPTSDRLMIQTPMAAQSSIKIQLFNELGKRVLNATVTDTNDLNFDVSTLPKGIYTLLIHNNESTHNQLLIIK